MKYVGVNRAEIVDFIPYTIEYLENIDRGLSNAELIIRDADSSYWDLRLEEDGVLPPNLYGDICRHTNTHCCKCGSDYNVRKVDVGLGLWATYASDGVSPFDTRLCANCHEELYREKVDAVSLVKFQIKRCTEEGNGYRAPHKKVRLLTADEHVVYRFVDEISVVGEKYFITQKGQESKKNLLSFIKSLFYTKREVVTILGVDTGKRDINDERIFTGDVLLVKHKQFERKLFAEMQGFYNTCSSKLNESPQKHYWWLYDGENFPTPFSEFTSVEVVGYLCNESMRGWQEKNINQQGANDHETF